MASNNTYAVQVNAVLLVDAVNTYAVNTYAVNTYAIHMQSWQVDAVLLVKTVEVRIPTDASVIVKQTNIVHVIYYTYSMQWKQKDTGTKSVIHKLDSRATETTGSFDFHLPVNH